MDYQYDKLLLRQTRSKSQVEIYLADDELVLESNIGRLFIVVEIFSREKKTRELIKQMITNLETDYYSSPTPDIESSLETTCQNFNANLPDLINQDEKWLKKLNILVGVIRDNQIFLSSFGKFKTLLIRNNKLINIIPEPGLESEADDGKIFSNLIAGEIQSQDVFLFSIPCLFDYFSLEKIKKTLATLNPEQAVEYFKNLLLENVNPVSFAALIFKFAKEIVPQTSPQNRYLEEFYGTQESMASLANVERKTTQMLTSNLMPSLKRLFKPGKKIKIEKDKKELVMPEAPVRTKFKRYKKKEISLTTLIGKVKESAAALVNLPQRVADKTKNLNTRAKVVASVFLVLILVFAGSLLIVNRNQKIKTAHQEFLAQVKKIEEKIDQAQAALIYQDEEAAAQSLKQAKILLIGVPQDKPEWQKKYQELDDKITNSLNKVYHIFAVEPTLLANLEKLAVQEVKSLIKNKNQLFVLTSANNFYQIQPADKSFTLLIDDFNFISGKNWDEDNLIFLDDDQKFTTYNLPGGSQSTKTLDISDKKIIDWTPYADKLYLLDTTAQQIFKVSRPLSSTPQVTDWYQDDLSIIENAKNLIIDGDIWLVTTAGKIHRLYRGQDQAFEIKKLNQDLGLDLELYTESNWEHLYLLDKQNIRLIVLRKSGVVEKQFLSDEFKQAAHLTVNDEQTFAWLSLGGKILEVDLRAE